MRQADALDRFHTTGLELVAALVVIDALGMVDVAVVRADQFGSPTNTVDFRIAGLRDESIEQRIALEVTTHADTHTMACARRHVQDGIPLPSTMLGPRIVSLDAAHVVHAIHHEATKPDNFGKLRGEPGSRQIFVWLDESMPDALESLSSMQPPGRVHLPDHLDEAWAASRHGIAWHASREHGWRRFEFDPARYAHVARIEQDLTRPRSRGRRRSMGGVRAAPLPNVNVVARPD